MLAATLLLELHTDDAMPGLGKWSFEHMDRERLCGTTASMRAIRALLTVSPA
jgi:hypothetical protein